MNKTKEFALILSPTLLKNLILVGCAILLKETVNLNKLKNALGLLLENEQTLPNSHYRRLTRFFEAKVAQRHLWKGLIKWLMGYIRQWDGRQTRLFLTLDATCWELGQTRIQLLVLSLVYRGISLPLCWVDLGKKVIHLSKNVSDFCRWRLRSTICRVAACWPTANTWAGSGLCSWNRSG